MQRVQFTWIERWGFNQLGNVYKFFLLDKIDGNYHIDTTTLEITSNSHITTRITGNVLTVLLS